MITATPRTVVVTGAAGFIGSHTVDRLLSEGHRVLGIDDLSTGSSANLSRALNHPNFELVIQDVVKPRFLETYCNRHQPDAIVHLAGLVSVARAEDDPELNFRLNVKATQVVAEAARRCDVKRLVFASSAAVYGDAPQPPLCESALAEPVGNYGNAKLISELMLKQYARSYGITAICNRYFNVFGPRQDPSSPYSGVISLFTDRYSRGLPVTVFGDGGQTRDFISVHDVAVANTIAATADHAETGSYNICTGNSRSLSDRGLDPGE
ncbi:MAG: NAD-dependent epimerase/dehydratase family protein [Verrucomicrobiota bacterium]